MVEHLTGITRPQALSYYQTHPTTIPAKTKSANKTKLPYHLPLQGYDLVSLGLLSLAEGYRPLLGSCNINPSNYHIGFKSHAQDQAQRNLAISFSSPLTLKKAR